MKHLLHKRVDSFDIISKFQEYFTEVKDPRAERTRWHLLTDIITISIMFVIAGAQGWEDIEEYGLNKKEWLETFLELPEGIPSPDTFRRVFEKINPKEFEQCFRQWVQSLVEKLGKSKSGRTVTVSHVPDFFVIRLQSAGFEEWKTEKKLEELAEAQPNRYIKDNGQWHSPPAKEYGEKIGATQRNYCHLNNCSCVSKSS